MTEGNYQNNSSEEPLTTPPNKSEYMVWLCGLLALVFIVTPPLGFVSLICFIGIFWYWKKPSSPESAVRAFFKLPKKTKVVMGVLLGGYIGAFMGVAAMGNAIAATLPLAALTGYLVHLNTEK